MIINQYIQSFHIQIIRSIHTEREMNRINCKQNSNFSHQIRENNYLLYKILIFVAIFAILHRYLIFYYFLNNFC